MKNVFRCEKTDGDYVEVSTSAVSWPELLEEFENYLRACGFVIKGHFTLECDEEDEG